MKGRLLKKTPRVVVAMSGGVDSTVAAYLLKKEGFEVIGITLKVWSDSCMHRSAEKCCGPDAINDARNMAALIGIPHYVLDEADYFEKEVISYFINEYSLGRTPNPCVKCNEKVKFGRLWARVQSWDVDYISTGHYAVVENQDNNPRLKKAKDKTRDQSYFLFSLSPSQLSRMITPLGNLEKKEVRAIAKEAGLKVWNKEESREICFVPGKNYMEFIKEKTALVKRLSGPILNEEGMIIGKHQGIENYTVGQRKGLPGGQGQPLYVIDIDPQSKSIRAGGLKSLYKTHCFASQAHWIEKEIESPRQVTVKLRYNYPEVNAVLTLLEKDRFRLDFETPQPGISPGQAAVCYDGEIVLGGGWIERQGL
ncbi:tRNA 2-thiouridine(34) synthase MnmA [Methylacidiphilum caldifontis]|uniref:tRNA-specific 2-thiouridylase MnmA n=1 Tax=Methylacidiphilum caldifontis TaxID=2795386 RepID=A0A4Y8PBW3_9BACT|nr:tRNA 2-thiouridine(34) synthase MnmA [Methylacidiphilum caldifontis]TFE68598.1 tRNA 2-thiouridine(34) synthase MnmA [Methylacidiphilum caldifontis]